MRFILYVLAAAAAVTVVACSSPGIRYHNELTGETVEVRNPPKSIAPATFSRGSLP